MRLLKHLTACAVLAVALPSVAQEAVFPGDSTSGTYHDYMKTVYARAGYPENIQLPLTSFDAEFNLHGLGAESWMQSEDGRTWTFQLREGLKFSDGHPLRPKTMFLPYNGPRQAVMTLLGTGTLQAVSRAGMP